MYLSSLFLFFTVTIFSLCSAETQSKSGEFIITSPLDDGVYVAGQQLPITYILLDSGSGLNLNIYFQPGPGINSTGSVIAQNADVSKEAGAVVTINGKYYWQHTYNYKIADSAPPGSYHVVFESVDTNTNTSVPVLIRPYVNMTVAAASFSASASAASATESTSTSKSMGLHLEPLMPFILAFTSFTFYSLMCY
ncbi:hypothetical protein BCR42DRAFT_494640 [Absidia repens]|uniref:Ser-Thr-rich glycosyl-phosphatidyl-inositol-anchored membrane family-domain-containing protein n=1 Tax=Absidia repens TaxID=90262 RepID=A0A1X2I685_9FUNG|nr:hypothetical protein BCR42DRAFT_494640 [Absidia repens]